RYSLVSGCGVHRRKQNKNAGFLGIGDPELASVQKVVIPVQVSARLQCEGVGAGSRLAQRIGTHGFGCHARQVALLLLRTAPAQQSIVDQRVLHIDDNTGGSIDAGKLFDGEDGLEKLASRTAILFGNLDSHKAELEKLIDQFAIKYAFL